MTKITETEYEDLLKRAGVETENEYVDTGDLLEIIANLQRKLESTEQRWFPGPRKLTRDTVISVTTKDLVGVYFADTDGSEILIECSPANADEIIEVWNKVVEDERET